LVQVGHADAPAYFPACRHGFRILPPIPTDEVSVRHATQALGPSGSIPRPRKFTTPRQPLTRAAFPIPCENASP